MEQFAAEKLARLTKYLGTITSIDVELYEEGRVRDGSHIAEVTVFTNGPSFRTKTSAVDHRAAIDMALERLRRQMTDFKRRRSGKPAHARPSKEAAAGGVTEATELELMVDDHPESSG